MEAALLLLPCLVIMALALYGRVRNPFHPAFLLVAMFVPLAAGNFLFADLVRFYPLRAHGAGALTLSLTTMMLGALGATLAYPPDPSPPEVRLRRAVSPEGSYWFAVILFGLFALSTIAYWSDVAGTIGLGTVFRAPARLKSAELGGLINPDSPGYFFRNTLLVPVALTMAVYANPKRWSPKLFLAVFLFTILISVRRGPILQAFGVTIAIASISTPRFRTLLLPLAAGLGVFLGFSLFLMFLFRSLNLPFETLLFGYTAGNLSSFQAALDGYYPGRPQQPVENTLYFFYSLFKYFDPTYAPVSVIKPNPLQPMLPNTYTFLADFYLDAGVLGLVLFPGLVGLLIGFSYSLAHRRPHYVTYAFYGAVYAIVCISFVVSGWGWFTIPLSAVQAGLLWLLLLVPCEAVIRLFATGRPRFGTA